MRFEGVWFDFFKFFFLREKYSTSNQHLSSTCLCHALIPIKLCLKDRQEGEEPVFCTGLKPVAQPFAWQIDKSCPEHGGTSTKINPRAPERVVILYLLLVLG